MDSIISNIATKKCNCCFKIKSLTDFYKKNGRRDGHQPSCKNCQSNKKKNWCNKNKEKLYATKKKWLFLNSERYREWDRVYSAGRRVLFKEKILKQQRERNKKKRNKNTINIIDYIIKNGGCIDCRELNPILIDFDHIGDKKFCISNMIRKVSWETLLKEINKCVLRCVNCHTKKTAKELGYYKYLEDENSWGCLKGGMKYRRTNRKRINEYFKEHPCVDCGETDFIVLDFDHVSGIKSFNISSKISSFSWKKIEEEIKKCEVRCKKCHRLKTAKDKNWYKIKCN